MLKDPLIEYLLGALILVPGMKKCPRKKHWFSKLSEENLYLFMQLTFPLISLGRARIKDYQEPKFVKCLQCRGGSDCNNIRQWGEGVGWEGT